MVIIPIHLCTVRSVIFSTSLLCSNYCNIITWCHLALTWHKFIIYIVILPLFFFFHFIPGESRTLGYACMHAKLLQSCPTLCDPRDHSSPGSSILGFLQARILEWVAVPSSRGSSQPRDLTCIPYIFYIWQVGSLPQVPPGKPKWGYNKLKTKNTIKVFEYRVNY